MRTFLKDVGLGWGDEDSGNAVQYNEEERFHRREGVAEVDERSDKDQKIEDEGSHIAKSHDVDGCGED